MMAQTIACDLCGQESAVMLETRIETGEVIAVGASCLIPFYVGAAEALADGITGEEGAAYLPAVTSLSVKWAQFVQPGEEVMPDEQPASEQVQLPGVPTEAHVTGASPEAPDGLPGVEDASMSGEGITVITDQPARQVRNRTQAPK